MINQTPAGTTRSVNMSCTIWCYYSPSIFLTPLPKAIIPEARPLEIKMTAINGKTRYISMMSRKSRGLF